MLETAYIPRVLAVALRALRGAELLEMPVRMALAALPADILISPLLLVAARAHDVIVHAPKLVTSLFPVVEIPRLPVGLRMA